MKDYNYFFFFLITNLIIVLFLKFAFANQNRTVFQLVIADFFILLLLIASCSFYK
jgi:hypothetical protein